MKKIFFIISIVSVSLPMFGQNVGIGTSTPNALLDVSATNGGILIPRVALTGTGAASPLASPTASTLVYNTATVTNVTPGYYYWSGTAWIRLIDNASIGGATTVSNTSSANTLSTTMNGVTGTGVNIINSNTLSLTGNTLTSTVNGIAPAQSLSGLSISGDVTGTLANSSVGKIQGTGVTISSLASNNLLQYNGTNWVNVTPASVLGPATTNTLALSTNTLTSTVNGVAATSSAVSAVSNTSNTNTLSTTVNGVTGSTVPIVNSISNASSANTLTTTVNGLASSGAPIINTNILSLSGSTLTSTINGIASSGLNIATAANNIYNTDGTLTGNRTVTMGADNLTFSSSTGNLIFNPSSTGYVGIGITVPTSQLHTTGTVRFANYPSGVITTDASGNLQTRTISSNNANQIDMTNGNGVSGNPAINIDNAYAASVKAGFILSGGANITYNGSAISWSNRFIVINNGTGSQFSTNGYFDITQPASGTVITGMGSTGNVTVTASGVPLACWTAIYYILPIGSSNGTINANFRIVQYGSGFVAPENWIMLAAQNCDDNTVRVGNGTILSSGQTWNSGIGIAQNSGNGNYIQNQTGAAQTAGFNINGNGTIGGALSVSGTATVTGLITGNAGLSTNGTVNTLFGGAAEIMANADNHNGGGIAVSDDGGFYDFNDGPVTFLGSTGLKIAGNSGTASSNAYLRVNGLAGTGNRAVYADANGTLTVSGKNIGYYVNKAGFTMSYPGNHTDVMQVTPAVTSSINVITGDVIVIHASYKFKLNGGSGTDQPKYGFIVTGACGTINVIDNTQNEYGDDVPRSQSGMQNETWIWVATCSGAVQFTWGLDWVNFDDAAILSDFVYTATKY